MFFKKFKTAKQEPALRMAPENINTVAQLPPELLTPLAVRYINKTIISGGAIVTLRRGEEILSLAVMEYSADELSFDQLVTAPQYRHQGYGSELFHRLLAVSDKTKNVIASLNTSFESYPFMKKILLKEGFTQRGSYTTYIAGIEELLQDSRQENIAHCRRRLLSRAERDGFSLVSFSEADEKLLDAVRLSRSNDFKNTLDPSSLFKIPNYILRDKSFILAKNGEAAAYSILSEAFPDMAEFDQLAAAEKYRSSGLALLPGFASFDRVVGEGKYKSFMWQIFDGNVDCSDTVSQIVPCRKTEMRLDSFHLPARA